MFRYLPILFMAMAIIWPGTVLAGETRILMVLWRGFTDAEGAFKARLEELGIQAAFTEINPQQDPDALATALRQVEGGIAAREWDVVYSYGTTVTAATSAAVKGRIPIVFNIVFDPVSAKLVQSLDRPGGPVTGVTNSVPIPTQFDRFLALAPMRHLLVLYNGRELNGRLVQQQVSDWARAHGVAVTSRQITPGDDSLARVLEEVRSGRLAVDAAYAGADTYLATQARLVSEAIGDKVLLFGGTQTFVWRGWAATYAPLVTDTGRSAAEQVRRVLAGEKPATLPVVRPPSNLIVSRKALATHGIPIPQGAIVEE